MAARFDPRNCDREIVIQVNAPTRNPYGEAGPSWSTFATVWAEVMPVSGREAMQGGQILATADSRFRIRYLSGLKLTHRISYESNTYDIVHIAEIGRRAGHEILAKMKAAAAVA